MKRRAFLTTSGTALLAGCGADNTESEQDTDSLTTQTTEGQSQTESTQSDADTAEIVIDDATWETDGERVEYIIGNNGTAQSGFVTVVTQWFDSDGHYVGNDQVSIPTLHPDKAWNIQVETSAPFEVSDFDAYVEYEDRYVSSDLVAQSIEFQESIPAITGIVDHNRNEETAVEVVAVTYDSGWISHVGSDSDTRIPDSEWKFLIPLSQVTTLSDEVGSNVELMFHVQ
ncbi:FxLYD domain-containing protein [Haloferax chudinovii]|uniref:FxLYD domain-containing protein n=1 Tax=Haloferax chudinovii TaxID=1109010 RepID=A0ABD5XQA8_9EURY